MFVFDVHTRDDEIAATYDAAAVAEFTASSAPTTHSRLVVCRSLLLTGKLTNYSVMSQIEWQLEGNYRLSSILLQLHS